MSQTDDIALDVAVTRGRRTPVGVVGVDAGQVMVANRDRFLGDVVYFTGDFHAHRDWVVTSSGTGDGVYDVVTVRSDTADGPGPVTGVEVVYLSTHIEAAFNERLAAEGVSDLTPEEWNQIAAGTASPELTEKYRAHQQGWQDTYDEVWTAQLSGHEPTLDSTPTVIGALEISGGVEVGDPCYGAATLAVPVPAGRYVAVAWMTDAGVWGTRVARLGLYRTA